jgi:hypothetical protein
MKVKLRELKDSIQALNRLAQTALPVKLSYRLMRITKDGNREFQTFHAFHIELILKHGGIQSGEGLVVPPERMPEFAPEYKELAEQEVELWGDQLNLEDFFEAESWRCSACNQTMRKTDPEISASDLMLLSWLFKEPDDQESGELPANTSETAEAAPIN